MKKKSQMEIMGLAVIVILITLGILFVLQFVVFKPQPEIKKTFIQTQTAANTLTTLLRTTTTDCLDTSIMELLQNCAEHIDDEPNMITCNGDNSCDFVKTTIGTILTESLEGYGIKNYEFRVIDSNYFKIIEPIKEGECLKSKESKQAYFQTYAGIVTIYLDVC